QPRAAFGGGSCATCRVPSTFFRDGRVHRLGTATSPSPHAIDDGIETPTLLGTSETKPYFHDGRFGSLREGVGWLAAASRLRLSAEQRNDLTAYVEAVGAIDRAADERPTARALNQAFACIAFAADEDQTVRRAAIDLVVVQLTQEPAAVSARVGAMRDRLALL